MNLLHFMCIAWLARLKNLDLAKALNSIHSSNLKPHMETRSNRLPKMLNCLTASKAKARDGVRCTIT
eukprot:12061.XXX_799547_799744_1 [CDS] Oithona nana genome sequencing.